MSTVHIGYSRTARQTNQSKHTNYHMQTQPSCSYCIVYQHTS